jgi:hypothetical protein
MVVAILFAVALHAQALTPVVRTADHGPGGARAVARAVAADTLVVTNSHPHEMTIVLITDAGEKELGKVSGGATTKLAIAIPAGAKELKLKASFALMDGMEVTTTLPVEPGKGLAWSF